MTDDALAVAVLAAADVLLAAAIGGTTRAGMVGKLGRNGLAGIRIPSTMASDRAWRAGHAAAWPIARALTLVCLAGAALGLGCIAFRWWAAGQAVTFAPVVIAGLGLIPVVRAASRAAREADSNG